MIDSAAREEADNQSYIRMYGLDSFYGVPRTF